MPRQPPSTCPDGVRITMRARDIGSPCHKGTNPEYTYIVTRPNGDVYVEFTIQTFCAGAERRPPRVTWRKLRDGPTRDAVRKAVRERPQFLA